MAAVSVGDGTGAAQHGEGGIFIHDTGRFPRTLVHESMFLCGCSVFDGRETEQASQVLGGRERDVSRVVLLSSWINRVFY